MLTMDVSWLGKAAMLVCLGLPNAGGDHCRSLEPAVAIDMKRSGTVQSRAPSPSGCNPKGAWSQGHDVGGSGLGG